MTTITVIGSGDTLGTPLAGCKKPSCLDDDVKSSRTRFGILIEHNGYKILIDTNPDIKWQCIRSQFELREIDMVLITHTHSDHINGMGEFFYRRSVPTRVLSLENPLIQKHMDYFGYLEREKVLSFETYNNYVPIQLEDLTITPIDLNHGFPCSGFIIEVAGKKVGIVSDTRWNIPEESLKLLLKCDYFFIDTYTENLEQVRDLYKDSNELVPDNLDTGWYHMTLEDALKMRTLIQAKKTYTVHMSRYMSPHKELVEKYQTEDFIIGYDDLKIIF